MTSAFSWQNSISLGPASFCAPRPSLPVTHIYIHTYIHIHTYIYIYIHIHTYIYIILSMHLLSCLIGYMWFKNISYLAARQEVP